MLQRKKRVSRGFGTRPEGKHPIIIYACPSIKLYILNNSYTYLFTTLPNKILYCSMQKIAVIDMGTNTFHLLIASVEGNQYEIVLDNKQAVGLGRGGINNRRIMPDAMTRALTALRQFKMTCDEQQVDRVLLTGTSAVRTADNQQEFLTAIKKATSWSTLIIDGEQEASWIYEGVKQTGVIPDSESSLLVDIGGGSVEFVLCNARELLWKQSFEIGGQRLMDKFNHADPITETEIKEIAYYLKGVLQPLWEDLKNRGGIKTLIGSSGSFDTLCDIYCQKKGIILSEKTKGYRLPLNDFQSIAKDLLAKDRAERLKTPGMIVLRVDMIVVSLVLIETLIEQLQIEKIEISFYALKEGLMKLVVSGKL
jgi:exopolyphosphatase/guanosine-5'-triphosphate,3'-diphosphate pyrophosphatase